MAKPLGSPKTGGRKKGTPNKKTLQFEEALEANGVDIVAQLAELLPQLVPEKRADILMALMSYQYPKRKAVEVTADLNPQLQIDVSLSPMNCEASDEESLRKRLAENLKMLRLVDENFDLQAKDGIAV